MANLEWEKKINLIVKSVFDFMICTNWYLLDQIVPEVEQLEFLKLIHPGRQGFDFVAACVQLGQLFQSSQILWQGLQPVVRH